MQMRLSIPALTLLLAVASASNAQSQPPSDDLIVPGLRVGPVSRTSTERSLLEALGSAAVKQDIETGEGMKEPGLMIYKDDPARRLAVLWNDETPPHPATIFICYGESSTACRWRTPSGIAKGATLQDLEARNGGPFKMMGWGTDVGGNVVSYEGGKLETELKSSGALTLNLVPRIDEEGEYIPRLTKAEFDSVQGDVALSSGLDVLQRLNPYLAAMTLEFPRQGGRKQPAR